MGGHRASGGSEGDLVDGPVDLAAVRADDALIDALAGGAGGGADGYGFGGSDDDDRLAAILAAWRADIEADPMPELVSLDEAAEAVAAGHESRDRLRSRGRRRMPFAIAAVGGRRRLCRADGRGARRDAGRHALGRLQGLLLRARAGCRARRGGPQPHRGRQRRPGAGRHGHGAQRAGPGQHRHPAGGARAAGPAGPGARPGAELDRVRPVALVPRARRTPTRARRRRRAGAPPRTTRRRRARRSRPRSRPRTPPRRPPTRRPRPTPDPRDADDPPPSTTTNGLSSSPGATSTTG